MSERGVFAVDRGIFDHAAFDDEPFTQREAWIWLIGEAAYKPHRRRVGGYVVDLKRGQVAASSRFLAEKWSWNEPKVRRFLKRLKSDAMIYAEATQGLTVITICNYSTYQRVSLPPDAPNDAPNDAEATQKRRKVEDKEYKEIHDDDDYAREPVSKPIVGSERDQSFLVAEQIAAACGYPDPKNWPPGWCGAPMWVQKCLNEGWEPSVMIAEAQAVAQRKRDGPVNGFRYLEKPIAAAMARHNAPLPKVELIEQQPLKVIHGSVKSPNNLTDASDRILERVRSLTGATRDGQSRIGPSAGAADVRLLPAERSQRS